LAKPDLEGMAIYLSSVNCHVRQHPGIFYFNTAKSENLCSDE